MHNLQDSLSDHAERCVLCKHKQPSLGTGVIHPWRILRECFWTACVSGEVYGFISLKTRREGKGEVSFKAVS